MGMWFSGALGLVLLLVATLHLWLLLRVGPAPEREPFDGVRYRIGAGSAYLRRPVTPCGTVVAVHGFLQSPAYFRDLYQDPETELILVGCSGYHAALHTRGEDAVATVQEPASAPGTIDHDAELLIGVLETLVSTRRVRVHGHSRGGGVVLEAARRRPDLFVGAQLLLEAPALPGGSLPRTPPRALVELLPWFLPAWRQQPINRRNQVLWGDLENARKRALIAAMPCNVRRALVARRSLLDILAWFRRDPAAFARSLSGADVLVAGRDCILDPMTMRRTARAGGAHVRAVPGCSHFITLDRPDALPALPARAQGADGV
ncbi:MAG: alpha/beta hydrolase [Ectothiorhodospiraceae bacterium]